jgi:signal transduction histidine kinase
MLRLVNDLLDLERLESSSSTLSMACVSMQALAADAIATLTPLAQEAGVELVDQSTEVDARADRDRIEQVLLNLVGNAIKFSPPGGHVTVAIRERDGWIEVDVVDEGRGIPEDRLKTLFRRFAQIDLDDARRKKGAGLGLAISRAIIDQHGGRIWAENGASGGSVFRFTLPAATPRDGTPC